MSVFSGGSPYATVAILDIMEAIKCDVSTVAFGMVASTATLLLVSLPCGLLFACRHTWHLDGHTYVFLKPAMLYATCCSASHRHAIEALKQN